MTNEREIKFRGWHEADKVMVYDLNSLRLFHGVLQKDDYKLMQYTGLKDKNGKEIYEGDILRNETSKILIENEMQESCGCCGTVFGWDIPFYIDKNEIIGNIHENPELLNEP